MTAVKSSVTDSFSVHGDIRDRKTEIDTDVESNASSSEDSEYYYSPKSVVVRKTKRPGVGLKEVNSVSSRARVHDPILRIRAEDRQIGEDIGEGLVSKLGCVDVNHVMMFCRPTSPLGARRW